MLFFNRINKNVLDRIVVTVDDIERMSNTLDAVEKDKELVKELKELELPFDTKGILHCEMNVPFTKTISKVEFYYNINHSKGFELCDLDSEGNIQYRVILDINNNLKNNEVKVFRKQLMSEKAIIESAIQFASVIMDFFRYAQYMSYKKQDIPMYIKRTKVKSSSNKSQHNKVAQKDNRAIVSVSKPKKVYDYDQAEREGEKRSYERHIESWEVAGHWREYKKTGKRVFVKGYKKGSGKKKGKDYVI